MPGVDENREFVPLKIAVLTISDTRNLKDDKSGALLVQRIVAAGHLATERSLVPDDIEAIRGRVKQWIADPSIDVIITTGGTGFTGRDVTPEAVEPLFEKKMDAFSALFLVVSFPKIGRRRFSRAPRPVSPARLTFFACPARPAPVRTPGTKFWCISSIIVISRAISSRSCRGSTSICAARRREARRFEPYTPPRITDLNPSTR